MAERSARERAEGLISHKFLGFIAVLLASTGGLFSGHLAGEWYAATVGAAFVALVGGNAMAKFARRE